MNFRQLLSPRIVLFVRIHDLIMAAIAFPFALFLRVGMTPLLSTQEILIHIAAFTAIAAAVFPLCGLNRGSWRYASIDDMIAILRGATVAVITFVLVMFAINRLGGVPRSVPIIMWFVLIALLSGPRLLYRLIRTGTMGQLLGRTPAGTGTPVLIYGYGDEADLYIRAMQKNRHSQYHIVGIIDQRARHKGRVLHGVPVIGTLDDLPSLLESRRGRANLPQGLIISRQKLPRSFVSEIVDFGLKHNLKVYKLSDLTDMQDETGIPEPKAVQIEDLLGRQPKQLDLDELSRLIKGRTVMITGAGGSIGSELTRQIASYNPAELVLYDNSEFNLYTVDMYIDRTFPDVKRQVVMGDVRNGEKLSSVMKDAGVETVFHSAALKHVPLVEHNPIEGVLTNVHGSKNAADAALENDCLAFVLISTDKAVNPTNVMGATKRVAEAYCQALDLKSERTRFVTVRFGNVLGSTGSVVPLFQRQIEDGGPVTITHPDITRYFMTTAEAVQLVLQASSQGLAQSDERGKIYVLDMGEPVRVMDLARRMIQLAGLRPDEDIPIEITGLRPGEKLYEELFDVDEELQPTSVQQLRVASPRAVDLGVLERSMTELKNAAERNDRERVLGLLHHIVPEFEAAASSRDVG